jgi:hypothetical protein
MHVAFQYLRHQLMVVGVCSLWYKHVDYDKPFVYVLSPEF